MRAALVTALTVLLLAAGGAPADALPSPACVVGAEARVGEPYCDRPYGAVRTQTGTVYRTAVDHQGMSIDLEVDVWEPVGDPVTEMRPVLLWMHGGFFEFGDKRNDELVFDDFATRGFVVVTIDYRLRPIPPSPGLRIPLPEAVSDALEDAVAAVEWIHANAAALRIDRSAVIAAGYSAGGITALGLAHKPTPISEAGSTTPIAAAVSFSGLHLHGEAPSRAGDPPALMFNSLDDGIVPFGAARAGCLAVIDAGSRCDMVVLPDEGHTSGSRTHYQSTIGWLAEVGITQLADCERFVPPALVDDTQTPPPPGEPPGEDPGEDPPVDGSDPDPSTAPPARPVTAPAAFTG